MLPPIDPVTFEKNPGFGILYKDLCTKKLNLDGSSKLESKKARVHEEIRRNLHEKKVERAKEDLLLRTLSNLPSKAGDLPLELHQVIEIVTAQLSGAIPDQDRAILKGDVDFFLQHIEHICDALSDHLTVIASHICTIANPLLPPSIPSLSSTAASLLKNATQTSPASYSAEHIELSNLAYQVLNLHRQVAETVIYILESTMCGSIARANKARAELLGNRAKSIELQSRIHTLTHPPPRDFLVALKGFKGDLEKRERELRDREHLTRGSLAMYDRAGRKVLLDIARRKEFLVREIEGVWGEVRRLEGGE
ncbi:hypothetical protein GQ43DRAFT_414419 [Delitschia confertaspora ATCC 74209]|uniref:Uncharacterized protein n=1 Tax=Delitschia confertaspora ATCC 74209 TaxID=1513339 RepID=A0A9P4JM61_9PLEO|nr:hypothetical protein GQ43DRAFT_414419 [Delitschia confertaspora ATCC 74209]